MKVPPAILDDYEKIPPESLMASKWLVDIWERLGRPQTPFSESGAKLMNVIIAVWQELYPQEAKEWLDTRKEYKANEMSIQQQIKQHTGRSLASYPFQVFMMMKKLFPKFSPSERKNCMKMVTKWPMFLMAVKK
jgi:hypothetical protein